ncbi:Gfo/Idh/MocA family oxidoreductase, partial [Sphaerochaeta sp. S2]|uniref:Gfo/Idh/MocA family oxidoreductase n=1 Tax=Sphaerochaeta sp. S2 TaxID=2798868 RepID=UPI0018E9965A
MVRYALVGYGKVAHVHAKAINEAEESTLVAVWGRNNEKAQTFATEWNITAFT